MGGGGCEKNGQDLPRLKFVSVFMMGGALLVKLTRGPKMQESPENNLRTEDSICLFMFNVLLRDCVYLTCVGSDGSRSELILQEGAKRR
jgi:hypothetical protein